MRELQVKEFWLKNMRVHPDSDTETTQSVEKEVRLASSSRRRHDEDEATEFNTDRKAMK
jgi:hypothetical protein